MERKKKKSSKPTYLREVQIRFKKKRVKNNSPVGKPITEVGQIIELFGNLQNEAKEKLIVICVDAKLKILCFEVVAVGSLGNIKVRPAESMRTAILVNAHGVIFVHNHPSGDPLPSIDDKKFTHQLARSCADMGIILLDHVIIGHDEHFSFTNEGLLD